MDGRTIQRFNIETSSWEDVSFENLVDKDIFRIFDLNERYVNQNDGNNVWIAIGNPYLNDDGIYSIKTVY